MMQQRVDQRAVGITRRRMHHHAGRLVDHDQVLVLVGDDERDLLRGGCGGHGFWNGNLEAGPFDGLDARLAPPALHRAKRALRR
jgi:hypothetical protein